MLNQNSQQYAFGVEYAPLTDNQEELVNPRQLQDLWIKHLRYEQELYNVEDAIRRPLTHNFQALNFFAH